MNAFQKMDADLLADQNVSETITYWRNGSLGGGSAVPAFTLRASPNFGGAYADPNGPLEGSIFLSISDVPSGPLKGDRLTIPSMGDKTFFVQETFTDPSAGWAEVKIRLAPK